MATPDNGGPDRRELRNFGLSLGVVCLLWAAVLAWRDHDAAVPWLIGAAPLLALAAFAFPGALRPVHRVWMPAARGLARGITWLLLTIVFYLVFTPYGVIARATGKDPLHRKVKAGTTSYWTRRDDGPFDPKQTTKQY